MNEEEMRSLVGRWSRVIGVAPTQIRIVRMKKKWASVSEKGVLSINYYLQDFPKEVVEYVVVHELIHLKTKIGCHNRLFKATLGSYMPDWREREKKLREIRGSLEL